jgi:hypothetical protein
MLDVDGGRQVSAESVTIEWNNRTEIKHKEAEEDGWLVWLL